MRKLKARDVLYNISFDLKRMLGDNTPTKKIVSSLKARLEKIADNNYQKVDWG